jgi:ribokinase
LLLPDEALEHRPLLVPNELELAACLGVEGEEAALAALEARGISAVITLGAEGYLLAEGPKRMDEPAATGAEPVDTTGAGDTFAGVLATWLAESQPLRAAARAANVAAGLSVGGPGARGGMPTRRELELALHSQGPSERARIAGA